MDPGRQPLLLQAPWPRQTAWHPTFKQKGKTRIYACVTNISDLSRAHLGRRSTSSGIPSLASASRMIRKRRGDER